MRCAVTLLCLVVLATSVSADVPVINYVSADAVYVNVGRKAGLAPGSSIAVLRNRNQIATLEAVHVSSYSASCKVVEKSTELQAGDSIMYERTAVASDAGQPIERRPDTREVPRKVERVNNRVRGYLAFQQMWVQDMTGSNRASSLQPAVSGRFVVANLFGTGADFYVRHRSRMNYRPSTGYREWTHRLTELAVRHGNPDEGAVFALGRMVVDEVHGLGYIDGALVAVQLSPHYRVGVVGGLEPDPVGMDVQTGSRKFGSFVNWTGGSYSANRLALTTAFSGSYVDGLVDREFGYLQAIYSYTSLLYLYQSVEVDVNRKWRKEANGSSLSFSNFLFSANANPVAFMSLDFSYDARKNVYDYNSFDTPDSLFDSNTYSGYGGGMTLALPRNITLRGNSGVRYRGGSEQTNRYYTVSATARNLPFSGHNFSLRWSVSETPFVTAYRPSVTHRFPVGRKLRLKAGLGSYKYEQGPVSSSSWFAETGAYYTLGKRYYVSGDYRQYVGGDVDSFQLFAEVGVNI